MAGNLGDLLKKAGLSASPPTPAPAPGSTPAPAAPVVFPKKLRVYFQRKGQGGKTVTVISGLEADHEAILGLLRTELGVGGRVEAPDLILQGEQVERVSRWFESRGVEQVQR